MWVVDHHPRLGFWLPLLLPCTCQPGPRTGLLFCLMPPFHQPRSCSASFSPALLGRPTRYLFPCPNQTEGMGKWLISSPYIFTLVPKTETATRKLLWGKYMLSLPLEGVTQQAIEVDGHCFCPAATILLVLPPLKLFLNGQLSSSFLLVSSWAGEAQQGRIPPSMRGASIL